MTANFLADELDLRRSLLTGKEHELGARAILLYGHSADMLRQQQAEIEKLGSELDRLVELYTDKAIENEALKEELKLYADAIGEERGNKALRNNEIGKILTKVLDDCGLLKKASEK